MLPNLIYTQSLFNSNILYFFKMKSIQLFFASLFFIVFTNSVCAQYGNGYGNGYGKGYGNGYGNGSSFSNGSKSQLSSMDLNQASKPKEIPAEVTVAAFMDELKPALKLDELQSIAVSNVLLESIDSQGRILKLNLPQDKQYEELKLLKEKTDKQINSYLSPDQREKYLAFKEEQQNPKPEDKKEKKKEKKKKEKEKK